MSGLKLPLLLERSSEGVDHEASSGVVSGSRTGDNFDDLLSRARGFGQRAVNDVRPMSDPLFPTVGGEHPNDSWACDRDAQGPYEPRPLRRPSMAAVLEGVRLKLQDQYGMKLVDRPVHPEMSSYMCILGKAVEELVRDLDPTLMMLHETYPGLLSGLSILTFTPGGGAVGEACQLTGTISLSPERMDKEDYKLVFFHELGHALQAKAPAEFDALKRLPPPPIAVFDVDGGTRRIAVARPLSVMPWIVEYAAKAVSAYAATNADEAVSELMRRYLNGWDKPQELFGRSLPDVPLEPRVKAALDVALSAAQRNTLVAH